MLTFSSVGPVRWLERLRPLPLLAGAAMWLWVWLVLPSGAVHAQGKPPGGSPKAAGGAGAGVDSLAGRWLVPGDSALQGSRVVTGSFRYALTAYRDGDEYQIGRIQDDLAVDTIAGVPLLRRVQVMQRGVQRIIDSSTTDLTTMAPRRHRSEQPNRRIALDFNGRKVKVSVGMAGAIPAVVDTTMQRPVFDTANWDLLLRALPLAPGLRVRFLVYDVDAGVHEYRLAVTGSTTVLGEEAHIVTFTLSRTSDAVVWVGKTTGTLLQMETMVGGNTLLRQVRVP